MKITEKDLVAGTFIVLNDKGNFYIGEIYDILSPLRFNNDKSNSLHIYWTSDLNHEGFFADYTVAAVIHHVSDEKWAIAKNEKEILIAKLKLKEL